MKKFFIVTCLFLVYGLWAQEKLVFQFEPLTVQDVSTEEAHVIERLIQSYLSQKDGVMVRTKGFDNDVPEVVPPPPDFIVNGSLSLKDDNYVLELGVSAYKSLNVQRHISSYKSAGDMALSIRSIVEDTFITKKQIITESNDNNEDIRPERVLGLWRGDSGIEVVRFLPNGKAFAFFTSGVNMMLSYKIENNVLYVTQVSPNNERFYYPLPLPVAKKLASDAAPLRWELLLFDNGVSLRGTRFESTAEFETSENIRIVPAASHCEWSKMPR
ncbi:hypothetical protein AGMMS50212_07180 [Spirochaetia bacterium]|nr:hypothetical protein AGMMS50212_07180 [Spirochaetia bacterium]